MACPVSITYGVIVPGCWESEYELPPTPRTRPGTLSKPCLCIVLALRHRTTGRWIAFTPLGLIPPSRDYGHEQAWHDGNGHSHLQATLMGPALTVPVADGQPVLGTWQQIFHLECDIKPRRRTIVVTVTGD